MANGKVCTGFSQPWVAKYAASGTTITLTDAMALARGVSVTIEPETAENNNFYADNVTAESASGAFNGGTLTLTVDGLKMAARNFILGVTGAAEGWQDYGDNVISPYVAVGYLVRYMEDGVSTWTPTVLYKVKFTQPGSENATQEDEIDWQTQELTGTIFRADDANHSWIAIGTDFATEAAALAALKTKLGVQQ